MFIIELIGYETVVWFLSIYVLTLLWLFSLRSCDPACFYLCYLAWHQIAEITVFSSENNRALIVIRSPSVISAVHVVDIHGQQFAKRERTNWTNFWVAKKSFKIDLDLTILVYIGQSNLNIYYFLCCLLTSNKCHQKLDRQRHFGVKTSFYKKTKITDQLARSDRSIGPGQHFFVSRDWSASVLKMIFLLALTNSKFF